MAAVGADMILAWKEIGEHISTADMEALRDLDEADIVGVVIGLLVEAGYKPDSAEQLLIRAQVLEAPERSNHASA